MKVSHQLASGLSALAIATAAPGLSLAQDAGDDWDLVQDPERNLTMAVLAYDSGPAVAVRCLGGAFEVIVSGLARFDDQTTSLKVGFGDEELRSTHWWPTETPGLFTAAHSAQLARRLRDGDPLTITKPVEEGETGVRYVIPLVPSPAAIDTTLAACDVPKHDPRVGEDAWDSTLASDQITWDRIPSPNYPDLAFSRGEYQARVYFSCVAMPSGELRQCQVDSQNPANMGFDRAMLGSMRDARMKPYEPSDSTQGEEGRLMQGSMIFRIE
jgi:hypothetical protein